LTKSKIDDSFGVYNLIMATGGSAPNFSAGSIATAGGLTVELIERLINFQLNEVSRKIEGLEGRLATNANTVEDYKKKNNRPNYKMRFNT